MSSQYQRRREEAKERLQVLPTGNETNDLSIIAELAVIVNDFGFLVSLLKKIDLIVARNDILLNVLQMVSLTAHTVTDLIDFSSTFSEFVGLKSILQIIHENPCFPSFVTCFFTDDLKDADLFLDVLSRAPQTTETTRSARSALFHACLSKQNSLICLKLIQSISPSTSYRDFEEFSLYATEFITLCSKDQKTALTYFNFLMNTAASLTGYRQVWIIEFSLSIIPLLPHHSIHPSIVSFVNSEASKAIKTKFTASQASFSSDGSIMDAGDYLAPYLAADLWSFSPTRQYQDPNDVYNSILWAIRHDKKTAKNIINNLDKLTALPFAYIMKEGHEQLIDDCLLLNPKIACQVLSKSLTYDKSIAYNLKNIEKATYSVKEMISLDILDFMKAKLFDPEIIKEGFKQLWRRGLNTESIQFAKEILKKHYPGNVFGVNWELAVETLGDSPTLSSVFLFSEDNSKDYISNLKAQLIAFKNSFLSYIRVCPSLYQNAFRGPTLMLLANEKPIQMDLAKWALNGVYIQTDASLIEAFGAIEVFRAIYQTCESVGQFNEKISHFIRNPPLFTLADCAVVIEVGSRLELMKIFDALDSKNIQIRKVAEFSLAYLKVHNFHFAESDLKSTVISVFYEKVVSLLSNDTKPVNYSEPNYLIELIETTRKADIEEIMKSLKITKFKKLDDLTKHFIKLSIICYKFLASKMIQESGVDYAFNFVKSNSLTLQAFGISVLAQVPQLPPCKFIDLVTPKAIYLHKSLLTFGMKQNDLVIVCSVLDVSSDFNLVFSLNEMISYLDTDIVQRFIERTLPKASTASIVDSLPLFFNDDHLITLFSELRKRPLKEYINKGNAIRTALNKMQSTEGIYFVNDDFTLFCVVLMNVKHSSIVKQILDTEVIDYQSVFLVIMKQDVQTNNMVDPLLVKLGELSESLAVKGFALLSLFLIISETKEPYTWIKSYFETNPVEVREEYLLKFLPALVLRSDVMRQEHIDIFQKLRQNSIKELNEKVLKSLGIRFDVDE